MTDLELVKAVRALFGGNPERWTQMAFAKNDRGEWITDVGAFADGCCWCLRGAALVVSQHDPTAELRLACAIGFADHELTVPSMVRWNDDPTTSFAEVNARLAEAGARLANA